MHRARARSVGADPGPKADKAMRLGIPTLSERAFEALVADRPQLTAANKCALSPDR